MLFIIDMEPLQRLFDIIATTDGLLSPMGTHMTKLRASLYADDAWVFLNLIKEEVQVVANILPMFGQASGLHNNIDEMMEGFQCSFKNFPCSYLGLPLHIRELR